MKRLLFLFSLLATFVAHGQTGINQPKYYVTNTFAVGKEAINVYADASMWVDIGKDTTTKGLGIPKVLISSFSTLKKGVFVYSITDSNLYHVDGSLKIRYLNIKDTSLIKSLITQYAPGGGTVNSVAATVGYSGTAPSVTGSPITTNGTLAFNFPLASGVGVTAGLIGKTSYDQFLESYNNQITNAAFAGGITKTLTLTQHDGGTLTATVTIDSSLFADTANYALNAGFLGGQNGAYYRNRTNHTGTQPISTVALLQATLDLKVDSMRSRSDTAFYYTAGVEHFAYTFTTNPGTVTNVTGQYPLSTTSPSSTPVVIIDTTGNGWHSKGYYDGVYNPALGYTPVNPTRNIITTYPLQGGGNLSADRTLAIDTVQFHGQGYYDLRYAPIAINGTVTNVSATDGTEIDFTVTNATTTPNITASIINASIANSKLANSTISGKSLGTNLDNHTNGYGLSGSPYNGGAAQTWNVDTSSGKVATQQYVGNAVAGYVPTTRQINTTSPLSGGGDLSANRTLTISDAAADGTTKGASAYTASDFNSTTGVISLDYANGQKATTGQPGFLNSTDFITFNNKVSSTRSIATTSPLTGGGDLSADRTISINDAAADGSTKGASAYTASDFNATLGVVSIDYANGQASNGTVPGFQTAANFNTSTAAYNDKINSAAYSGAVLTLTQQDAGTVTATIPDATTSTKGVSSYTASDFDVASGVVNIDYINGQAANGSVNGFLSSGNYTLFIGAYNDKVVSAGLTGGTLTLTQQDGGTVTATVNTTNVTEGTNLYYTDTRARAAISLTTTGTSGAATYNNTTGVLNVPQYSAGAGTGDVTGPASATDNAIARFDLATGKLIQNSNLIVTDGGSLDFTGQATQAYNQGLMYYDTDNECLTFNNNNSAVSLQVGQEEWIRVMNNTGSTIADGSTVYINGASSGMPTIALAQSNAGATTVCSGLTTGSIANGAIGFVTCIGLVRNINTAAFTAGSTVYLSSTVAGGLTSTAPLAPNYRYRVGIVGVSDATLGTIHVTPSTAALGNGTANQLFGMNTAGTLQEVKTITAGTGITVTPGTNTITIAATGAGGSAPAGSTTELQYRVDATTFGAMNVLRQAQGYENIQPAAYTGTVAAPTTGNTIFTRSSSNNMPAYLAPNDAMDQYIGSHAGIHSVSIVEPKQDGTAGGVGQWSFSSFNTQGTANLETISFTNKVTSHIRQSYTSASTAGATASITEGGTSPIFRSAVAGDGGFEIVLVFSFKTFPTTARFFTGLATTSAALSNANPSTQLNLIGISKDIAETSNFLQFITNDGAGTAVKSSTGIVANTTSVYVLVMSNKANTARIDMTLYEYASGVAGTGASAKATYSPVADLPVTNNSLFLQQWINNGTTASAVSMNFMRWYRKSDL